MSTPPGFSPEQLEDRGAGWTAREIAQQPAVWKETGRTVGSHREDANAFLQPLLGLPDLRIVLTGAGTSAFVGEILAPALSLRLGRRVDAVATTDIVSNPNEYFAEDLPTLLVSFARSGNSPESAAATALADRCLSECHHLVLTCDPDGQLYTDHAGGERSLVLLMPGHKRPGLRDDFELYLDGPRSLARPRGRRSRGTGRTTLQCRRASTLYPPRTGPWAGLLGLRAGRLPRERPAQGPGARVRAQDARADGGRGRRHLRLPAGFSARAEVDHRRAHAGRGLRLRRPLHAPVRPGPPHRVATVDAA